MTETSSVIETKAKAFASDLTSALKKKRDARVAELKKELEKKKKDAEKKPEDPKKKSSDKKKEDDPEKMVTKVTFSMSSAKGSIGRTPEQQAEYAAKGTSWTCAGAHMLDLARHVSMLLTEPGKSAGKVSWDTGKAFGAEEHHFMTYGEFKTEWGSLMKKHGLKNYKGGDGWGEGDGFHLELPESKVPRTDKRVQTCLDHYAKITILEGWSKNTSFEKDWKSDLKSHLEKYQAIKDKEQEEKRREELKSLRFAGTLQGKGTLLKGVNKSQSRSESGFGEIVPPSPIDSGRGTAKQVALAKEQTLDSLAREVFEFIGVLPTSGYDIRLRFEVSYRLWEYAHLSQGFVTDLAVAAAVDFNTPAAPAIKVTVDHSTKIGLTKSSLEPTGVVAFTWRVTTPVDDDSGTVMFTVKGAALK